MDNVLFVDSCVDNSRTRALAEHLLSYLNGNITTLHLDGEALLPLTSQTLQKRNRLIEQGNFTDPMFSYANQVLKSDVIVIAAPLWDLSFPAMLKAYIEHLPIPGLVFRYTEHGPVSFCKAKSLYFVSTSGGPFVSSFGFDYVKAFASAFLGIKEIKLFSAELLDVDNVDVASVLQKAREEITQYFTK